MYICIYISLNKKKELDRLNIKSLKNTMKLHAVVGVSKSSLLTQVIMCYCEDCLNENFCTSLVKTTFEARSKDNVSTSMEVEAIVHAYKEDEHLGETSLSGEGNENVDTETDSLHRIIGYSYIFHGLYTITKS